jgi:4-diphosphocytidyl-2-C-methyl-D-erythritol kinase
MALERRGAKLICMAPAKVNLTLRILGRRDDGYHWLESLMVPISLFDTVEMQVRAAPVRQTSISCLVSGPARVAGGADNLAAVAARSVLEALDVEASIQIALTKRIPAGTGLGGGSSDAAAVLRYLPGLLGRRLGTAREHAIATSIGADVPFFLACRPALARGIGERLSPLVGFPKLPLVVAVPKARVETAWAYANALDPSKKRLTTSTPGNTRSSRLSLKYPEIGVLASELRKLGAVATVMSGTGSSVVGIFGSSIDAQRASETVMAPGGAFAVRVIRRRPARRI